MSLTDEDIERIRAGYCPYCGKGPFALVLIHTARAHGKKGGEVREEFGLNRRSSVVSQEQHEKKSRITKERIKEDPVFAEHVYTKLAAYHSWLGKTWEMRPEGLERNREKVRRPEHVEAVRRTIQMVNERRWGLPLDPTP